MKKRIVLFLFVCLLVFTSVVFAKPKKHDVIVSYTINNVNQYPYRERIDARSCGDARIQGADTVKRLYGRNGRIEILHSTCCR